jgi:hypothetical protein
MPITGSGPVGPRLVGWHHRRRRTAALRDGPVGVPRQQTHGRLEDVDSVPASARPCCPAPCRMGLPRASKHGVAAGRRRCCPSAAALGEIEGIAKGHATNASVSRTVPLDVVAGVRDVPVLGRRQGHCGDGGGRCVPSASTRCGRCVPMGR